jgi:hypothetical protein
VTDGTIEDTMIRPSDLLVSPETLQRREQKPRRELAAFDELTQLLAADSPHALLCRFTDVVLRMYGAGSAGISVLRPASGGHRYFEWQAVSGALAAHQGDGTPGDFSPCGLCLDIGTAIVLARPERAFTYLARVPPAILEILIGPLYDQDGTPLGALWVAHHDPVARFGAEDVLIIERLATPIVLAMQRAQPITVSVRQHTNEQHVNRQLSTSAESGDRMQYEPESFWSQSGTSESMAEDLRLAHRFMDLSEQANFATARECYDKARAAHDIVDRLLRSNLPHSEVTRASLGADIARLRSRLAAYERVH